VVSLYYFICSQESKRRKTKEKKLMGLFYDFIMSREAENIKCIQAEETKK